MVSNKRKFLKNISSITLRMTKYEIRIYYLNEASSLQIINDVCLKEMISVAINFISQLRKKKSKHFCKKFKCLTSRWAIFIPRGQISSMLTSTLINIYIMYLYRTFRSVISKFDNWLLQPSYTETRSKRAWETNFEFRGGGLPIEIRFVDTWFSYRSFFAPIQFHEKRIYSYLQQYTQGNNYKN